MDQECADRLAKHQLNLAKLRLEVNNLKNKVDDDDDDEESSLSGVSDLDDEELRLRMEDIQGLGEDANPILKAAHDFANSDHYRNILKDRITIKGKWEQPQYLCTNPERRGIQKETDVEKAEDVTVSAFELFLLTSGPIRPDVFSNCIEETKSARERGEGPLLAHCLAWLSFAAQSAPEKLLPPGEIFPEANAYIQKHLDHPGLPLVADKERVHLALCQTACCFEFLSESDLSRLSITDRSFLLFLISRILLDRSMNEPEVISNAKALISHIFKSAEDERKVLLEFAQIFPHLCEDLRGIKLVLGTFRAAKDVDPATCLCLMAAIFIHVSERAECAPEDPESLSPSEFAATYATIFTDTFVNVLDVFAEERNQQAAVIAMIGCAMHHDVFFSLDAEVRQQIVDRLEFMKRSWRRKGRTDDIILEMMVGDLIARLSEDPNDDDGKEAMDVTVASAESLDTTTYST